MKIASPRIKVFESSAHLQDLGLWCSTMDLKMNKAYVTDGTFGWAAVSKLTTVIKEASPE